jgi:hypothetical protein
MNGNGQRRTLSEEYGRKTPDAWEAEQAPLVTFFLDGDEEALGLSLFGVQAVRFLIKENTVSIEYPFGNVVVAGPKAREFFTEFCRNKATAVKADGRAITSVTFVGMKVETESESATEFKEA